MNPFIQLHPDDNVVIALKNLEKGAKIDINGQEIQLGSAITFGHKIAIKPIKNGAKVLKYGHPIGSATQDIEAGQHVDVQNLASDYVINDLKQQN